MNITNMKTEVSATPEAVSWAYLQSMQPFARWMIGALLLCTGLFWTSVPAKASEIVLTDTVPLTRTPWVKVLSVPQFDPSLGALQQVELSFRVHLRGAGYYENRAEVSSTLSFEHQGEIAFNFDNGDEVGTINTVAKSSLVVPAYDGVGGFNTAGPLPTDDEERLKTLFNGTSGGVSVAEEVTADSHIYTATVDLQRFLGTGEVGVDIFADAESRARDTTGNVDYELRAFVGAEMTVIYRYLTTDIQLEKTVYSGHNSGQSCAGIDKLEGELDNPITYCFKVTNTGETFLSNIVISDTTLGITEQQMTLLSGTEPLAPNASMVFYIERTLDKSFVNTAIVEGTPTSETGTRVQGLENPTDEDIAEVSFNPAALDETDEPSPTRRMFLPLVTK